MLVRAAWIFRRPAFAVRFWRALIGLAVRITRLISCRYVSEGNCAFIKAIAPATCGVAIEVPLFTV